MSRSRTALWVTVLGVLVAPVAAANDVKAEAKAKLASIETRLDAWDVEGARAEAEALAKLVPAEVEALLYYQGRIAFEEGRYDEAVELLHRAGMEDKPESYLRLAKETDQIVGDYERVESEHFIFLYPKGKDEVLAPYALETLEAIRKAMLEDLGYAPPGKVRVEVVGNARELAKVSTLTAAQIRQTGTIAICKFNKLMVTSPKAVVRGYDWQDTLAHEYIHLVVSRKSGNTVPIWLHEGLAKYLESRWRGEAGLALGPAQLALLGHRVKQDKLIPFEKMHPSIALLPTAEDASTAFAEVFFAIDLIFKQHGSKGLQTIIDSLKGGKTDRAAVEAATGKSFPAFEKAWLNHVRKQPFPQELLPLLAETVTLKEDAPGAEKKGAKGREISFGEFAIVTETEARKFAHLGEVLRERNRAKAAAIEFGKAHRIVGDKYQSVSDKYALSLLEIGEVQKAEQVLLGSLRVHPGIASTQVHLGRIYIARKEWEKARKAFMDALASDPFDPEIHVSLTAVGSALNRPQDAAMAKKHSAILTGLDEKQVDELVKRVVARSQGKLSSSGVDTEEEAPPASPGAAPGEPMEGANGVVGSKVGPIQPGPERSDARAVYLLGASLKDSDPLQAGDKFREVLQIAPPGSEWYDKAKRQLQSLGKRGERGPGVPPDEFFTDPSGRQRVAPGELSDSGARSLVLLGQALEANGNLASAIEKYRLALEGAKVGSEWHRKAQERLDALGAGGTSDDPGTGKTF